jgi:hypothetical protein
MTNTETRPVYKIAGDILTDWKQPYFGARPYLEAMQSLNQVTDSFGWDTGSSIINYFLANAASWRGPKAKEIKTELKNLLKK